MRTLFRDKLGGYVRVYAFLSQNIPYTDSDLEMLYSYGRFLLPHLPPDGENDPVKFGDEVDLQFYRLQNHSLQVFKGSKSFTAQ